MKGHTGRCVPRQTNGMKLKDEDKTPLTPEELDELITFLGEHNRAFANEISHLRETGVTSELPLLHRILFNEMRRWQDEHLPDLDVALPEIIRRFVELRKKAGENPTDEQRREMKQLYAVFKRKSARFMRAVSGVVLFPAE